MTWPFNCQYHEAGVRAVLAPLPVASSITFHVDDRPTPAVYWLVCVVCRSSVGLPVPTPGV